MAHGPQDSDLYLEELECSTAWSMVIEEKDRISAML